MLKLKLTEEFKEVCSAIFAGTALIFSGGVLVYSSAKNGNRESFGIIAAGFGLMCGGYRYAFDGTLKNFRKNNYRIFEPKL